MGKQCRIKCAGTQEPHILSRVSTCSLLEVSREMIPGHSTSTLESLALRGAGGEGNDDGRGKRRQQATVMVNMRQRRNFSRWWLRSCEYTDFGFELKSERWRVSRQHPITEQRGRVGRC